MFEEESEGYYLDELWIEEKYPDWDDDPDFDPEGPIVPSGYQLDYTPLSDHVRQAMFASDGDGVLFSGTRESLYDSIEDIRPEFFTIEGGKTKYLREGDLCDKHFTAAGRLLLEEEHHLSLLAMCDRAGIEDGERIQVAHFDGITAIGVGNVLAEDLPKSPDENYQNSRVFSLFRWGGSAHDLMETTRNLIKCGEVLDEIYNTNRDAPHYACVITSRLGELVFSS